MSSCPYKYKRRCRDCKHYSPTIEYREREYCKARPICISCTECRYYSEAHGLQICGMFNQPVIDKLEGCSHGKA